MPSPTFKLPTGYASVKWGEPTGFTTDNAMLSAAIIKSLRYSNTLDRIKIEGSSGFVAGYVDMKSTEGSPSGGTAYDTETLTLSLVHGEHDSVAWPAVSDVVVISGCSDTEDAAKLNGDWVIVSENSDFARKTEGDKGYDLERYSDIALN